eukprot:9226090-Pyramimonas_sp.AAC.1
MSPLSLEVKFHRSLAEICCPPKRMASDMHVALHHAAVESKTRHANSKEQSALGGGRMQPMS